MNKRLVATAVAGTIAGAALVGVPTVALASQAEEPPSQSAESADPMGSMMSDRQLREQMKTSMTEMMADEEMREQMRSMMSDVMGGMQDMGGMHSEDGGMDGGMQNGDPQS